MSQGQYPSTFSPQMEAIVFIILLMFFATRAVLKIGEYLTIIPRARVGYEMIDSQRGAKRQVGFNHLISNKREWNNCFIKNHQQILLDFADSAWLEQPESNLMDAISRVWYNGSYTIAAKPIKTPELHYTMIQFLINICYLPAGRSVW